MIVPTPNYCRPQAYKLFLEQLPHLDRGNAVVRASVAVSMHELEEVDVESVDAALQRHADRILARVQHRDPPHRDPRALLAHAHEELFERVGFVGNTDDYHNPLNSYVPSVLESKRGLPIILTLIYKSILERLDIRVEGINSPGHFLAHVYMSGKWMIVDPFHRGQVLSRDEAFRRVEFMTGLRVGRSDSVLAPATPHQWLARLLRNLEIVFLHAGRGEDLAAMREMHALLPRDGRRPR